MATTRYVTVKISVPATRITMLVNYFKYFVGNEWTLLDFLNHQVEQFRGAFGPECTAEILETGEENV